MWIWVGGDIDRFRGQFRRVGNIVRILHVKTIKLKRAKIILIDAFFSRDEVE